MEFTKMERPILLLKNHRQDNSVGDMFLDERFNVLPEHKKIIRDYSYGFKILPKGNSFQEPTHSCVEKDKKSGTW